MTPRILFVINCLSCFFFISCSSSHENNNISKGVASDNDSALQYASNDFNFLENKLKQDSLNIELRTLLASDYYKSGQLDKAAYHFLIIYDLDNKDMNALRNLGNIFYDNQQEDKAIQFYEKALSIDPDNIDMKCDLATCYSRINRPKKAIAILKENIKTNYNHKKSHYNLSVILKETGNIKESDEEMKIYNSLNSDLK